MKKYAFGRIGILMGGPSTEREVSLKSGRAVYETLKNLRLDIVAIDIKTDARKENMRLIRSHGLDCVFLALHGRFGEDGSIQKILDELDLPYTGSGKSASELAMDKIASRRIFKAGNLPVPEYRVYRKSGYKKGLMPKDMSWPLVVKPSSHGSSIGLSIVDNKKRFAKAVDLAFSFDQRIIIEAYIKGREVTVGILDDRALPVVEIIPKRRFFDYEAKYHAGMTDYVVPAEIAKGVSKKTQRAALSAHKLLGCSGCSRVDIILSEGGIPFILEINSIPGFTPTSLLPKAARAAGIDFEQLCLRLIELSYEKKQD